MATWKRMAVLMATTIIVAIAAVIYYRVGVAHLFPMVYNQHDGPATSAVRMLDWMVPIALSVLELGVALWALSGGVQEERARSSMRGPR